MSTCNQLDLQTLGSQPVMSKNLPDHCLQVKQLEMCHPLVSGSICIEFVHPKNLNKESLHILRLPAFRYSKSLREIATH